MDLWHLLMEVVLLLGASFALGAVAQKLRQSAIIGYLLAGAVLGPILFNSRAVSEVAELGVALLLFSIGLEFSFSRLKSMGSAALTGGTLQVITTLALFAAVFSLFLPLKTASVLGAMVALSSTAVVLRILVDRSEIDSVRGRNALGILLFQDIAVVPMMLMVSMLSQGGDAGQIFYHAAKTLFSALGLVAGFYVLFYHLIPKILMAHGLQGNRDLVILLAIVSAIGSAWAAHAIGLSPALGAFLAGMILAESPFAVQVRSDIGSIRTLFVTLFFTSIGMLTRPAWMLIHLHWILAMLAGIIIGKAIIIFIITRFLGTGSRQALSTGITLSQVGEFSFVLAAGAHSGGLIPTDLFLLMVSATLVSLFLAPYMVGYADPVADLILSVLSRDWNISADRAEQEAATDIGKIFVIGFGPAGRRVTEALIARQMIPEVIELNPKSLREAENMGLHAHIGDAVQEEVISHAGILGACMTVVTLPDPQTAESVIKTIRRLAPESAIIVRSRYHRSNSLLQNAGATVIVDEEEMVGQALAKATLDQFRTSSQEGFACALVARKPPEKATAGLGL